MVCVNDYKKKKRNDEIRNGIERHCRVDVKLGLRPAAGMPTAFRRGMRALN